MTAEAWSQGFQAGRAYEDAWRIWEEFGYEPQPTTPINPYVAQHEVKTFETLTLNQKIKPQPRYGWHCLTCGTESEGYYSHEDAWGAANRTHVHRIKRDTPL